MGNVGHFQKKEFGRYKQRHKPSEKYSHVKTIDVLLSIDDLHLKAHKHR